MAAMQTNLMTKLSHFGAVAFIIVAGYWLSLGISGRAQVVSMARVVDGVTTQIVSKITAVIQQVASASENVSLSNVYAAFGLLASANPAINGSLPAVASEGLVVSEKTSDTSAVRQVEMIQSAFSDEVRVQPDSSNKSGTITPVFKKGEDQTYLYVIVPVQK